MTNSRPDQNFPPPGDEEERSDDVKEVSVDEQLPKDNPDIVISVPVCLPSDRPGTSAGAPATSGQFRPINLAPSTPTICIENGKITPQPVYPLKKRHVALPVAPPLMPRYSWSSNNNGASTSSQSTATESPASPPSRDTPVGNVNMEIASEEFAVEYARAPIAILPITCGSASAAIHIDLFTSGSHGRCIKYKDRWLTPREFEDLCGSTSEKDWKKNIKYGGHDLKKLIDANILKGHPLNCSCDKCVPDRPIDSTTEPLQLTTDTTNKRADRDPGPEQPRKRPRLLPPCSEIWQTAVDIYERAAAAPAPQPSTSTHPNPTPAGLQNHALNYSFKDAASSQTPTTSRQTPTNSHQTPTTSRQTPTNSHQTPTNSHQTPTISHQTPTTSRQTPTYSRHSPTILRQIPTSSRHTPTSSRHSPTTSRQTPTTSRHSPTTSRQTPTTSRQTPTNSHQTPTNSHQTTASSRRTVNSVYPTHVQSVQSSLSIFENHFPIVHNHITPSGHRRETYEIVGSARPVSQILEPQLPDQNHDLHTIQITNTHRSTSILFQRRRTTACLLCRATSYCKRHCQKEGRLRHVPCCLHGMKLEHVLKNPLSERQQSPSLPSDMFQNYQINRYTAPRGSMTARREFLVGLREYMPAPGEEVEIGDVLEDYVPPETLFFQDDQDE